MKKITLYLDDDALSELTKMIKLCRATDNDHFSVYEIAAIISMYANNRIEEVHIAKGNMETRDLIPTICDCAYGPKNPARSGSGHAETCPMHAVWLESKGAA